MLKVPARFEKWQAKNDPKRRIAIIAVTGRWAIVRLLGTKIERRMLLNDIIDDYTKV